MIDIIKQWLYVHGLIICTDSCTYATTDKVSMMQEMFIIILNMKKHTENKFYLHEHSLVITNK